MLKYLLLGAVATTVISMSGAANAATLSVTDLGTVNPNGSYPLLSANAFVVGVNNAFIGLTNFTSGNGVSTIDVNGKSGVVIAGSGSALNLSGLTITDSSGMGETATILANAAVLSPPLAAEMSNVPPLSVTVA